MNPCDVSHFSVNFAKIVPWHDTCCNDKRQQHIVSITICRRLETKSEEVEKVKQEF